MHQTLRVKLKGKRKLLIIPKVKKVKVITDDSIITVNTEEFSRIGHAILYTFVNEDNKNISIRTSEIQEFRG